jgi:hypothetical protein
MPMEPVLKLSISNISGIYFLISRISGILIQWFLRHQVMLLDCSATIKRQNK